MALDYSKFYNLEDYLFAEVGPRFEKYGTISSFDFYLIVIWKANQAKKTIRARLRQRAGSFTAAVEAISVSLHEGDGSRHKLEILMKEWGFRFPMATAILSVLYPNDFAVYDARVCAELKISRSVAGAFFSGELLAEYDSYLKAISAATPAALTLQDKCRYLRGHSLYNEVANDAV